MLETLMGKLHVDFRWRLLTDAPDKSFLFGVTEGKDVGTWSSTACRAATCSSSSRRIAARALGEKEKQDQALPRRLIVTYRSLPDQPTHREFSDWNLTAQPPTRSSPSPLEGAKKIELKPMAQ